MDSLTMSLRETHSLLETLSSCLRTLSGRLIVNVLLIMIIPCFPYRCVKISYNSPVVKYNQNPKGAHALAIDFGGMRFIGGNCIDIPADVFLSAQEMNRAEQTVSMPGGNEDTGKNACATLEYKTRFRLR